MLFYGWKVRALKWPRINYWWRYWRAWRGSRVGSYDQLPEFIRRFAPGRSFLDVGCMWGVNGQYAFDAEAAGAVRVTGLDVFGPTPEFEQTQRDRKSAVGFELGDVTDPSVIDRVGAHEVVFCAGVLYHHPSPFDLLVALRRLCTRTLILRTSTIPEVGGLPNAAVFFPQLDARSRSLWNLSRLGLQHQAGITDAFQAADGYSNWFWGVTPSCLRSMLSVAGFRVDEDWTEAFAHTAVCTPVDTPFVHRLPREADARAIAAAISDSGVARPA